MKRVILTCSFLSMLVLVIIVDSCISKFVPDPLDSRLPKYTEKGNQVGGALINDMAWVTRNRLGPAGGIQSFYFTNYSKGDSVTLRMDGELTDSLYSSLGITLVMKHRQLFTVADIKNFKGKTIELDGTNYYLILDDNFKTIGLKYIYTGGSGYLQVNNVKEKTNVTYKNNSGSSYHPVIISGIFDFYFTTENIKITSGRFDFSLLNEGIIQK